MNFRFKSAIIVACLRGASLCSLFLYISLFYSTTSKEYTLFTGLLITVLVLPIIILTFLVLP